jgi:hypothetical protein
MVTCAPILLLNKTGNDQHKGGWQIFFCFYFIFLFIYFTSEFCTSFVVTVQLIHWWRMPIFISLKEIIRGFHHLLREKASTLLIVWGAFWSLLPPFWARPHNWVFWPEYSCNWTQSRGQCQWHVLTLLTVCYHYSIQVNQLSHFAYVPLNFEKCDNFFIWNWSSIMALTYRILIL